MTYTHALAWSLLAALVLLGIQTTATGQVRKIDCAPPRGVSGAEEVAAIIADGERDCENAQSVLQEGQEWRRRSTSLRREAERFRNQAVSLRKDALAHRKDVETHRKRLTELQEEVAQLNARRRRLDANAEHALFGETTPPADDPDSMQVVPTPGASAWEERLAQLTHAHLRFIEVRLEAVDDEMMTLEGVIQVSVDVAADREASALDFEQLAINSERAAIESDAAASLAEDAALIGERTAILHHLHACTQFISLHRDDSRAKRDVGRAIGYIDKYKHLLSNLDAAEAERLVQEARAFFGL